MKKRILSLLLVFCMVLGMLPMTAFAADTQYKSTYGITVLVGDAEMDLVAGGTETCGILEATKLEVTVPAGTTEVTFLNITDTVVYGQMYVYNGNHSWQEFASNVTEATINLEECGTSFCVSDSANNWYHVNIAVAEDTCTHEWTDATCTAPKTCALCGETEGEALGHSYENGTCTVCGEADPDYVADPAADAQFVIKVNDVEMELVDGGIQQGCDSRFVSADVQLFNVTVPSGTTAATVALKDDATATFANIQYMVDGADHAFGGNAMPAFEADIVNYDGLCINCGGKYYHITFTEQEKVGVYQSITTDMEGDVIVTEQEMIDGWISYYHAVIPRGSSYVYVTYPADTIYIYEGQALVTEYHFDQSYSPQKLWKATENSDGSVTVAVPITDLLTEEVGTGVAVCFWNTEGGEVLEGFTFSYAEDTTIFLVTLAAGNGYTTDGESYVKTGEDYTFTVDIKNGYEWQPKNGYWYAITDRSYTPLT